MIPFPLERGEYVDRDGVALRARPSRIACKHASSVCGERTGDIRVSYSQKLRKLNGVMKGTFSFLKWK